MEFAPIFTLLGLNALCTYIDFTTFLLKGKQVLPAHLFRIIEVITIIFIPILFLSLSDIGQENDCCSDSAFFSPDHSLTAYTIIILCVIAYFYSTYRKNIGAPLHEVVVNCLLLVGIIFNITVAIHLGEDMWWLSFISNVPIILLFTLALIKSQKRIIDNLQDMNSNDFSILQQIAIKVFRSRLFIQIPILLILCLPLLIILSSFLLIFGQKPDSIIRAFTDTYKHGFSQLDYMCDNVQCGGHYLCSVAAKGHSGIVKPQRLGERNGNKIICNRQLLVSNAFEELLQEKLPHIHKLIRSQYNHIGNLIHQHYGIFENKFVSDFIYILMKPLEWIFIIVLYTCDTKPENRIAVQYLSKADRRKLSN